MVTAALVLALTVPGLAKKPYDFTLTYDFKNVDWDHYYAVGTFDTTGVIAEQDEVVTLHWTTNWKIYSVKQGMMVFDNEEGNTFDVRFFNL